MALHPGYTGIEAGESRSVLGPVAGIYVPTSPTITVKLDLSQYAGHYVRINAQAEDLYYVFTDDLSNDMDLTTHFDMAALVPDYMCKKATDRVIVPVGFPILLLRSASSSAGAVRIRRA